MNKYTPLIFYYYLLKNAVYDLRTDFYRLYLPAQKVTMHAAQ